MLSWLRVRRIVGACAGRVLMSAALAFVSLASVSPQGAGARSGQACRMACCAGGGTHGEDACAGGSCHANLSGRRATPRAETEELCGVEVLLSSQRGETGILEVRAGNRPASRSGDAETHSTRHGAPSHETARDTKSETSVASRSLTRPCQPDCGTGAVGSTTQGRQRDSASLAHADRPRPPAVSNLSNNSLKLSKTSSAPARMSRPRAPPRLS
ncbi:MAG TPA: hypothetical protein VNA19_11370 [Pyrinomonadaceae bacterium]|jgi:hypothetical protein|nr:hypothetical protein [Pyrinomonadaceae bacterium]